MSHRICTKVQKEDILWREESGDREKLRELCGQKGVNIIEAEVCADHIHMLVEISPKMSVSSFMRF